METNKKDSQSKYWIIVYNYQDNTYDEVANYWHLFLTSKRDIISYYVYNLEIGKKTGNLHIQAYIEFKKIQRFSTIKKLLPGARIENRKGTSDEASEYCKKDPGFKEYGELSISKQGNRTDINIIKTMVKNNEPMNKIIETATSYQSIKMAELIYKYKKPKAQEREVIWIYGPSGIGKSTLAQELTEDKDTYWHNGTKWFDGYQGEETVIIDDLKPGIFSVNTLLRLLDRFPYQVEIKGGFMPWNAKKIIITSIYGPDDAQLLKGEDKKQLIRRVKRTFYKAEFEMSWCECECERSRG